MGGSRFIPTRVGNTDDDDRLQEDEPVHPHARGEHTILVMPHLLLPGSSPRAWGTLLGLLLIAALFRFIPTRVGNTTAPVTGVAMNTVHPHARGEHWP